MTDPEVRVREALARVADDAPPPVGLAAAARRRARTRRRTWVASGSALVVAAVVVPVALALGSETPGGDVAPDPGTSSSTAPDPGPRVPEGWRVETWRDLSVAVPGSWGEGGRSDWCADGGARGGPEVPVVQSHGTGVRDIKCWNPEFSLGLTIASAAAYDAARPSGDVWQYEVGDVEMFLDGSWLGHWYDTEYLVQVNAADRDTVERILATVEVQEWTSVEHDGVTVKVPAAWSELDTSDCEFAFRKYGPPDRDPCGDGAGLAFYGSSTFDPAYRPDELHRDEPSGTWGGYTYAGDYAVWVTDEGRAVVERVLDSARAG